MVTEIMVSGFLLQCSLAGFLKRNSERKKKQKQKNRKLQMLILTHRMKHKNFKYKYLNFFTITYN